MSKGGLEHRQPACRPVAVRPLKVGLTRGSTLAPTLRHVILSNLVLTGPLANGLQRGVKPRSISNSLTDTNVQLSGPSRRYQHRPGPWRTPNHPRSPPNV